MKTNLQGGGRVAGGGGDQDVMIHIVPEQGKSKWSHIDDLDSFFSKIYDYHQKHGFTVMMLQEILELFQFIFIVFFTVFLAECVDYQLLFKVNGKLYLPQLSYVFRKNY